MAGLGDALVWGFLLLIASSATLRALYLFTPKEKHRFDYRKISRLLIFATLADAVLIAALWEALFLTTDLSYRYVSEHTAREHALLWKIEGLWAGQEGSIFLWATAMTIALSINEWLSMRREKRASAKEDRKTRKDAASSAVLSDWTAMFVAIVVASFGVVLVASNWFQAAPSDYIITHPSGWGLSPSLRTELNVIHPPIELTGYALTVMPMAAAFAFLATGDKQWIRYCSFWTRIAWVFLTLGLAIGGLWAYITLGWGGYWAWDPVEVASLLPWLATTALLHAQIMHRRHAMYPLAAPLLAALAFSLTEFGTFVTRSGVWKSVHSFIQSPNVNLGDAIVQALASDIRLAVFFLMIFVPLAILIVLVWHFVSRHYKDVSFLPPRKTDEDIVDYLAQDKFTVFAGIFALSVVLLMTFVILVKNAGIAPQPQEYETKLALPLFVILFFMTVNYLRRPLGNESALLVAVVASFGGAIAFILFPAGPAEGYLKLAGFAIVLAAAVFVMGALRIRGTLRRGIPSTLRARGRTLAVLGIHIGVAAVVLGYATSNALDHKEHAIVQEPYGGQAAVADSAFGYSFTVVNITKDPNAGSSSTESWDKFTVTYEMHDASGKYVRTSRSFIVYERISRTPTAEFYDQANYISAPIVHPDIYSTPTFDLYIQVSGLLPGAVQGSVAVDLSVEQKPGMWSLWTGIILMVGGMVALMTAEYTGQKKGGEKFVPADDPAGGSQRVSGAATARDAPALEAGHSGK